MQIIDFTIKLFNKSLYHGSTRAYVNVAFEKNLIHLLVALCTAFAAFCVVFKNITWIKFFEKCKLLRLYIKTFVSHSPTFVQISRHLQQLYREKSVSNILHEFCVQLQFSARTDLVLLLNFALGSSFFAHAQQWLHNIVRMSCSLRRTSVLDRHLNPYFWHFLNTISQ